MGMLDALVDVANLRFVTEDEASRRLAICKACPRFNAKLQVCEICFCLMVAKVKLESATCAAAVPKW